MVFVDARRTRKRQVKGPTLKNRGLGALSRLRVYVRATRAPAPFTTGLCAESFRYKAHKTLEQKPITGLDSQKNIWCKAPQLQNPKCKASKRMLMREEIFHFPHM